jgi:hypothetical protein
LARSLICSPGLLLFHPPGRIERRHFRTWETIMLHFDFITPRILVGCLLWAAVYVTLVVAALS